jgi:uncharacterized protein YkwD
MRNVISLSLVLLAFSSCNLLPKPEVLPPNELSSADQQTIVDQVNAKRASAATTPIDCKAAGANFPAQTFNSSSRALQKNAALEKAALSHANHMVKTYPDGFTQPGNPDVLVVADPHNGAGDGTVLSRITKAGFGGTEAGEVMAYGFTDSADVIDRWLTSAFGHCQVVMGDQYNVVGIAALTANTSSGPKKYWVMLTGKQ